MAEVTDPSPQVRIALARSFRSRLVGLLGRSSIDMGQGLWFEPCSCVHTFGMRFAIDLVFIDRHRTILRIVRELQPWRLASCQRARAVIELAAGACERLQLRPGQRWPYEPGQS